jgi:hypothetical protein
VSDVAKVMGGVMHHVACNPVRIDIIPIQLHGHVPLVGSQLDEAIP